MTNEPNEEYEDIFPLMGAIGPYLSFTTGHMNPIDETDEVVYDEYTAEEPEIEGAYEPHNETGTEYWEDEEE